MRRIVNMKVAFVSLGCAKNLVNTEQMKALVQKAGHQLLDRLEGADVAVVNTCGFIDSAKSEAIDTILQLAQLKEQGLLGKLLVAGCLSQRYPTELMQEMPEVDGVLGTGSYPEIVTALEQLQRGETPVLFGDIDHTQEELDRVVTTPVYSAYLKIAEGCDNRCSYCVIPSLRGRYRSRPMESLLNEARMLAEHGCRELIVVAQDITRYGTDLYGRRALPELLEGLCQLPFRWIRLHYLYPDEFDDALIDEIAAQPKILNYLDIPIQHINDGILKAMNRRGTGEEIRALFAKLRRRLPGLVLRTSIIAGLPGEGEAEFEELCEFLREAKIERAGIFPFSPEEGTAAAAMPDQVPEDVAQRRTDLLVDLQSRVMDGFNEQLLGSTVEVLCEGFDEEMGCWRGRTWADSPDIDGHVYFTAAGELEPGQFIQVLMTGTDEGDLTGEIEEEEP